MQLPSPQTFFLPIAMHTLKIDLLNQDDSGVVVGL